MFPAIDRRSGRSRYTSATRSSSRTATRCSPTSTETSNSRLASGRGARRGGSRRRRCGRSRSRLCVAVFRSVLGAFVAVFVFDAGASVFVSAVAVLRGRPRPPRLPRRRLGLVTVDCPAGPAGSMLTGSGVAAGAAASTGACSSDVFLDRNQRKKNLLRARALQQRRLGRRRGACAAGCDGRCSTSAHRVPTGLVGTSGGEFSSRPAVLGELRPPQVLGFLPK